MFSTIKTYFETLHQDGVSQDRKVILQPFIQFIQDKVNHDKEIRINFICTHNSRRSHLAQVWARAAAAHYNVPNVITYSAGTEVTALFPKIIDTLRDTGFQITPISKGNNPVYAIKYAANMHPIMGFSKTLDSNFNPQSGFAAVMTCDSANESCPFIAGAERRFPITYKDPKAFDNTPQQAEKYLERSKQIATEMLYVFSQISTS